MLREGTRGFESPRLLRRRDGLSDPGRPPVEPLTSREREIVQRIAEGQTTKEITWRLGLSVKTVESHRINLMRKPGVHDTATLVRYAIRRRLTLL
jgi:DNA-binding NarL/FixJ family response regulator